jgi:hypothetical protein
MTPEIVRKLNEFLDAHDLFKEECEAVYLMVELRKLIHQEHRREEFAIIRFYCDWTVHSSKERNQVDIKVIMEKLNKSLSKGNPYPKEDIFNFLTLPELRKEMVVLFERHSLRAKLYQDENHWTHFVNVLIQVLADQPIIRLPLLRILLG